MSSEKLYERFYSFRNMHDKHASSFEIVMVSKRPRHGKRNHVKGDECYIHLLSEGKVLTRYKVKNIGFQEYEWETIDRPDIPDSDIYELGNAPDHFTTTRCFNLLPGESVDLYDGGAGIDLIRRSADEQRDGVANPQVVHLNNHLYLDFTGEWTPRGDQNYANFIAACIRDDVIITHKLLVSMYRHTMPNWSMDDPPF